MFFHGSFFGSQFLVQGRNSVYDTQRDMSCSCSCVWGIIRAMSGISNSHVRSILNDQSLLVGSISKLIMLPDQFKAHNASWSHHSYLFFSLPKDHFELWTEYLNLFFLLYWNKSLWTMDWIFKAISFIILTRLTLNYGLNIQTSSMFLLLSWFPCFSWQESCI